MGLVGKIVAKILPPEEVLGVFGLIHKEKPAVKLYKVLIGMSGPQKAMWAREFITTYREVILEISNPKNRQKIKDNIDPFLDYLRLLAIHRCDLAQLAQNTNMTPAIRYQHGKPNVVGGQTPNRLYTTANGNTGEQMDRRAGAVQTR